MKFILALVLVIIACVHAYKNARNYVHSIPKVPSCQRPILIQYTAPLEMMNGREARPNQFPYQAALFIDGLKFCGGSLISRKYVLTAAHCACGAHKIDVVLGAHYIYKSEPSQVKITSKKFKVHWQWDERTLSNDIALIELPQMAPLSNAIKVVELPSRFDVNNDFSGCMGTISGWGKKTDNAEGILDRLIYVETEIITNPVCAHYFGNYIRPTNLCASGEGKKSSCNGDSGGPLTVTKNGKVLQVGITSFVSRAGCEAGAPHAYTRLTSYLDWIQRNSDVQIRNY